jgi:N-succinyldiaminopimelate aminotransferase
VAPVNPRLSVLPPYPFERLRTLLSDLEPPRELTPIAMAVGEPAHPAPAVFLDTLARETEAFSRYPTTPGAEPFRAAAARWLRRRFDLAELDPDRQVIACAGTREALFSIAQAVAGREGKNHVLLPNPFYPIYEGAALWSGATPRHVPALPENGFLPDYAALPAEVLDRVCLLYLCTPANPTGAVAGRAYLEGLIELADRHDFVLVSDECYSEIYPDEGRPPWGLLQAAAGMGRTDYARCLAFHSLSKRSNLPGARCGFIAGDAAVLAPYLRLRAYAGSSVPLPVQRAAAAALDDETHVVANRAAYRDKFAAVLQVLGPLLGVRAPDAGMYLWLPAPEMDAKSAAGGRTAGEAFAQRLYAECALTVLPGGYLSRPVEGVDPGAGYVRMALVDSAARCAQAAGRIRDLLAASRGGTEGRKAGGASA